MTTTPATVQLGLLERLFRRQQHPRDLHELAVLLAGQLLRPPERLRLVE